MHCIVLQREIDRTECDACWGDNPPGVGSEMHRQCQAENLREPHTNKACLYPTIQLDHLCDGCPVGETCELDIKGVDLLYGKQKKQRRGA